MPYLSFHVSAEASREQSGRIATALTELTVTILGKKRELTSVEIHSSSPGHWYIGGLGVGDQGVTTFYLDIKVTEGTNTKDEKAEYIRRVFDEVSSVFGPLSAASYIVIHEVHADAWGFEGQTQEFRYIRGKPL